MKTMPRTRPLRRAGRLLAAAVVAGSLLAAPGFPQEYPPEMGDSLEPGPVANLSPELTPTAIHAAMRKVADWQLARAAPGFTQQWPFGALYTGFMAASRSLGDPKYENAMLEMGKRFQWQLGPRLAHADGRLGSMQPVGEAPGHYEAGSSYVFGVGAFLLAGSELARFSESRR
jgi:hypothetical protein